MGTSSSSSACCSLGFSSQRVVVAGTPRAGTTSVVSALQAAGPSSSRSNSQKYKTAAFTGSVLPSTASETLPAIKCNGEWYEVVDAGPWYRSIRLRDDLSRSLAEAAAVIVVIDSAALMDDDSMLPPMSPSAASTTAPKLSPTELASALQLLRLVATSCPHTPLIVLLNKTDILAQRCLSGGVASTLTTSDLAKRLQLPSRKGPWLLHRCVAREESFDLSPLFAFARSRTLPTHLNVPGSSRDIRTSPPSSKPIASRPTARSAEVPLGDYVKFGEPGMNDSTPQVAATDSSGGVPSTGSLPTTSDSLPSHLELNGGASEASMAIMDSDAVDQPLTGSRRP